MARLVPDIELAHGAPHAAQLHVIIGLAHVALAALGDEAEGVYRQAVEDLDVVTSRLCDAVGDM